MNVLMIGDIVGKTGRTIVYQNLAFLKRKYSIDFTIANGENAAGGKGISPTIATEMFDIGIDVITTGNHIWWDKNIHPFLDEHENIIRPANYPEGVPGNGYVLIQLPNGMSILVINLLGRTNLGNFRCPFRMFDTIYKKNRHADATILDFHAEATSEKVAMGWYTDGRAAAVIGTHTHVQTADFRILPKGTAYMTDVGMCGSWDSVIGVRQDEAIDVFLHQMPKRFVVAKQNPILNGVVFNIDESTGLSTEIEPLWLPETR